MIQSFKCLKLLFILLCISNINAQNINNYSIPKIKKIEKLTSGSKQYFASAYYGQHAWSKSERYVVCLETSLTDQKPTSKDEATVGMIDLTTNKFIPLAKTKAWNFQQGAFVQWLGSSPDSLIIYNDCRKGKFVSVILNVHTRKERVINKPVLGVSNDGKKAIGVNFTRLENALPGFGYVGEKVNSGQSTVAYPDNDGLFLIDLESGKSKLVVTIADVKKIAPPPSYLEGPLMWFHHAHFNPNDSRVFFVAKTRQKGKPMASAAITMNPDGSDLFLNIPYEWDATHYDWFDNKKMVVTSAYKKKQRSLLMFTDKEKDSYKIISPNLIQNNGHPTFSPNKKWLLTDTYPDADRNISMFLVHLESEAVYTMGRYYVSKNFNRAVRCDLHADWSPSGNKIIFDSVKDGKRHIYMMELEFLHN